MTDPEYSAMLHEAANENFAWYLRVLADRDQSVENHALRAIRRAFKIGFVQGLLWQRRRDKAAGLKPP